MELAGSVNDMDIRALNEKIKQESSFIDLVYAEMDKVIVGQREMIESLMILVGFSLLQTCYQPI